MEIKTKEEIRKERAQFAAEKLANRIIEMRSPSYREYNPTNDVIAIGRLNLSGNVIPEGWYSYIRSNNRVNLNAIVILSELVHWYSPTEIKSERTGVVIGYRKRFEGQLLQKSYASLGQKFGLSKKQAMDACQVLRGLGLIETIVEKNTGNMMYIRIFPQRIAEITNHQVLELAS